MCIPEIARSTEGGGGLVYDRKNRISEKIFPNHLLDIVVRRRIDVMSKRFVHVLVYESDAI